MQQPRSIFVVDDDMSVRTSLKRLLREYGFPVRLFGSLGEIGDISDVGEAICVILDIDLNGRSGIDFRRKLAEEGVTAPVIYITGNDSAANRDAAIKSGCVAYLTKPFTAQSLIESVARAATA